MSQTIRDFKTNLAFNLFIYWLSRKLRLRQVEAKYGRKLFTWTEPYYQQDGWEVIVTLKHTEEYWQRQLEKAEAKGQRC